jgi:hypothetical protein
VIAFAGSDADQTLDRRHPHLAVADLSCSGGVDDRIDDPLNPLVVDNDLDAGLRDEVDRVLRPPDRPPCGLVACRNPELR